MPGPMPPQGAPQPDQDQQNPGAPPQAQGQGAGGAISDLLTNVDKAIDHLNMIIGQSKATNPEEKAMIGQIDDMFGKLMGSLGMESAGGDETGEQDAQGNGQGQTVPPEAGGNKGAIPAP